MKLWLVTLVIGLAALCGGVTTNAQSIAIVNARIVPVSGPAIEKGTVVVRGTTIESVGTSVKVPADAETIDGTGLVIYPGFIDTLTSAGLAAAPRPMAGPPTGGSAAPTPAPSNSNYPAGLRPELSTEEELKSGEAQFEAMRNAGFTTVLTVGRTGIFNGRSAVIDLAGDNVSLMIVRSPFAEHVSFTTIGGGQYPGSLLGTFSALRQMLNDARRLKTWKAAFAKDPKGMQRPPADRSLEALIPVIDGAMPVIFNATRETDIVRALDLAKEYNLKAMIAGGHEAWKQAARLKEQNVPVLVSANLPKRTAAAHPEADSESLETLRFRANAPKNAARLDAAGVKFAFQSDGLTDQNEFLVNVRRSVENGLSEAAAIKALTLGAAELLGISDRTGSVEAGKTANLTVLSGSAMSKDGAVRYVIVGGKMFEQKAQPKPAIGGTAPATSVTPINVAGTYTISIDAAGQPMQGILSLTQNGTELTGTLQTQLGTSAVNAGRVTADGFTFNSSAEVGGTIVAFSVKATVSGGRVTGTIDSEHGVMPFTGTKNP